MIIDAFFSTGFFANFYQSWIMVRRSRSPNFHKTASEFCLTGYFRVTDKFVLHSTSRDAIFSRGKNIGCNVRSKAKKLRPDPFEPRACAARRWVTRGAKQRPPARAQEVIIDKIILLPTLHSLLLCSSFSILSFFISLFLSFCCTFPKINIGRHPTISSSLVFISVLLIYISIPAGLRTLKTSRSHTHAQEDSALYVYPNFLRVGRSPACSLGRDKIRKVFQFLFFLCCFFFFFSRERTPPRNESVRASILA